MPRLFYTAPDGAEGTQLSVQSVGQGATRQEATFIEASDISGGVLPAGSYVGQPARWDGSAWVPLTPPLPLVLHALQSRDGQDLNVLAVDGGGLPSSGLSLGANVVLGSESGTGTVTLSSGATGGTFQTAPGTETVQHSFSLYSEPTGVLTGFQMGGLAGEVTMAFFGVALVTRPSITGATTQDQVDSLVAALEALGLVTDDR